MARSIPRLVTEYNELKKKYDKEMTDAVKEFEKVLLATLKRIRRW